METNEKVLNNQFVNTKADANLDTQVVHKSKLNMTSYSMLATHGCNCLVSVFVSTFLISYIYSISENYLFNIGLFYAFNYLSMLVFYYLISKIIDRTNRVVCYRVAILVRTLFILLVIFIGKDLAQMVIFAGLLHGFSEACYWCSFNLMKNELIPNHCMKQYSLMQNITNKSVYFAAPIILGKIVDAQSFKTTAIIVFIIAIIQMGLSYFIKSKRPLNSGFDLKGFFVRTKESPMKKDLFKSMFIGAFLYGFITLVSPLNTIMVMITFKSNFSLGLLTGIFSGLSIILLFCVKKRANNSDNIIIYLIASLIPLVAGIFAAVFTSQPMLIAYNFVIYLAQVIYSYFYDVYRNILLKKLDMYSDIAEYQCVIECLMELARTLGFFVMVLMGAIAMWVGGNVQLILVKVTFVLSMLSYMGIHLATLVIERKFKKYDIVAR